MQPETDEIFESFIADVLQTGVTSAFKQVSFESFH